VNPAKLVLHHTYTNGIAFDVSGCDNHGAGTDVNEGPAGFSNTMQFRVGRVAGGRDALAVAFGHARPGVRARFWIDPATATAHRHNLVEGHDSFALMFSTPTCR